MLLSVFILFAISGVGKLYYQENLLVKALFIAMEAALVGGIADWFAVTALFRKPLGFPWHTAIIPRNREKIIDATAHMVQHEFFSREKLKTRLENIRLIEYIVKWLESDTGSQVCGTMLARFTRHLVETIEPRVFAVAIEKMLKNYIVQLKLTPAVRALGEWVLQTRQDEQFFAYIIQEIGKVVSRAETRQAVYDYLEGYKQQKSEGLLAKMVVWLGEKTNAISINDAADSFYQQLVALLADLQDPGQPLRLWLHDRLEEVVRQIEINSEWQQAIEGWKESVITRISLAEILTEIIAAAIKTVGESAASWENTLQDCELKQQPGKAAESRDNLSLKGLIVASLEKYWSVFKEDREVQHWLEGQIKDAIYHIIDSEHHFIGVVVKNALKGLSDKELNKLVEAKAGEDLQWIRINGSLVGGATGFAGYLIMQFAEKVWHSGLL